MTSKNTVDFFKKKSVLVIDDCQMILNATRHMLIRNGCEYDNIYLVKDARMAVSACISRSYDFILCDYNLGKNSDGLQLLEELHKKKLIKERTVVFVVTGEMSKSVFFGFSEFSPDGYLIKPINIDSVTNRLINCHRQKNILQNITATHKKIGFAAAIALCDKYEKTCGITYARAQLYINEGKEDIAQKIYIDLIKNKNNDARIKLAIMLLSQKKYALALKLIEPIITDKKLRFSALQIQAECFLQQKQVKNSSEVYREMSTISPNNIERLLIQYNLAILTKDTDEVMVIANRIKNKIKYSIWNTVDISLLHARSLLYNAEKSQNTQGTLVQLSSLKVELNQSLKLIEKQFNLSHYQLHRELILCRFSLLSGDIKSAKSIWDSYQQEAPLADFYAYFDALHIQSVLGGKKPTLPETLIDSDQTLSQEFLIKQFSHLCQSKKENIAQLKNTAIALYDNNEHVSSVNQWLEIWQKSPFEVDTALSIIKGLSSAIPMSVPIENLRVVYQQANETITSRTENNNLPDWFITTNKEVSNSFTALEQQS